MSITPSGSSYTISASVAAGTHPLQGNEDKGAGKIEFIIDGQVVDSKALSGNGMYSGSYSPGSSGSKQVSARVIDSVMYDATVGPTGYTFVGGSGGGFSLSYASGKFNWSGEDGRVTVYSKSTNAEINGCVNRPGTSCTPTPVPASGTIVYARDEEGNVSNDTVVN